MFTFLVFSFWALQKVYRWRTGENKHQIDVRKSWRHRVQTTTVVGEDVLPLDDAIVIQLSLWRLHDVILLPGDLKQGSLGKPFDDVIDHSWQQFVGGEAREGTDCVFHRLCSNTSNIKSHFSDTEYATAMLFKSNHSFTPRSGYG